MTVLDIIFCGSGSFGTPTLTALVDAGHRVVNVITQPDKPAGRGNKLTPTPIALQAESLGLTTQRTNSIDSLLLPPADVMVVIAFGQKIGPAAVNHARLGAVNLHASRLPKYRGAAPIHWAIINGDASTGNSIIRLADRMDAGAILNQTQIFIGDTDTTGDLHDKLASDGTALMLYTLKHLADGSVVETQQDESSATAAPKLSRESAAIDFESQASVVARRINGLSPWPGCRVQLVGSDGLPQLRLTLLRARPVQGIAQLPPGTIDERGYIVTGGGGAVQLIDVQPDGKRSMPFDAFRLGYRWLSGQTVASANA